MRPIVLTLPGVDRARQLYRLQVELSFTAATCRRILEHERSRRFDGAVDEAFSIAVIIRYVRWWKSAPMAMTEEVAGWIPRGLLTCHEEILALRDRHYAHDGGELEANRLIGQLHDDGTIVGIRDVKFQQHKTTGIGTVRAGQLLKLAQQLLTRAMAESRAESTRVDELLAAASPDQLRALPTAFPFRPDVVAAVKSHQRDRRRGRRKGP